MADAGGEPNSPHSARQSAGGQPAPIDTAAARVDDDAFVARVRAACAPPPSHSATVRWGKNASALLLAALQAPDAASPAGQARTEFATAALLIASGQVTPARRHLLRALRSGPAAHAKRVGHSAADVGGSYGCETTTTSSRANRAALAQRAVEALHAAEFAPGPRLAEALGPELAWLAPPPPATGAQ